jgi:hypothetical protein
MSNQLSFGAKKVKKILYHLLVSRGQSEKVWNCPT